MNGVQLSCVGKQAYIIAKSWLALPVLLVKCTITPKAATLVVHTTSVLKGEGGPNRPKTTYMKGRATGALWVECRRRGGGGK